MTQSRTIAVCLTGPGRGAVATVLIEGTNAVQASLQFFESRTPQALRDENVIHFGHWRWQSHTEELVVCRTASDRVEVHCHGGEMASRHVLASLQSVGIQPIDADSWLESIEEDCFVREARRLLGQATTERVTAILLDQLRGAMCTELRQVVAALQQADLAAGLQRMRSIIERQELGSHLLTPWSVVLMGPPNVGKSSLINALLGFDRVIVHDRPGTTRDLITTDTAFDGWPIRLMDTAGVRQQHADAVEREGIRLSKQQVQTADLVLLVRDGSQADELHQLLLPTQRVIYVQSKADLNPTNDSSDGIGTSVISGDGIPELIDAITNALVPQPPEPGVAVPVGTAATLALQHVVKHLERGDVNSASAALSKLITADE